MPLLSTRGAASARGFGFGGSGTAAQATDPYFNYTTLLLPGNGTNGGQNNTFLDSSSNNFTITRNGDTTQGTFSPFSLSAGTWSNYFDGSGDYLTLPSNSAFAFGTGDFTAECWVYFISFVSANQALFDFRNGLDTTSLEMGVYSNNIPFLSNSSGGVLNGSFTFSVGTWYHIAYTRSGTSLNIWVNGTNVGSTSNSTNWTGNNCKIGGNPNGAENPNAYISNARVVKGTAVYTSAFTPPTAPLTAISGTSLLTCQNNRFIDNSSNNFTITRNGDTSVQAFSPFAPTAAYSASTVGGSGYFDGSGDYLSIPSNTAFAFGTGDFTVEGWIYYASVASNSVRILATAGAAADCLVEVSTSSELRFYDGSTTTTFTGSTTQANAWNHIAVTRSGTSLRGYINGAQVGSTVTNSANIANTQAINFPATTNYAAAACYISNVRYLKGTALYTGSTYTIPTAPLTNISNTSLLCNFTNAAIIDNTAKNDLETVADAQISTAQSKFGGGSLYFDGTGDLLVGRNSNLLQLASGPFTIEFWYRTNTLSPPNFGFACIVGMQQVSGAGGWGVWQLNQTISFFIDGGASSYATGNILTSTSVWYHVAVTRDSSNNMKTFIDGVQQGSQASVSFSNNATQPLTVGGINTSTGWNENYYVNGYIDDLRITKGIARYTSNFTPPTSAFPLL